MITEQHRKIVIAALVLVIAGALVSVYHSQNSHRLAPRRRVDPVKLLGEGVADETAKLLRNRGSVVLVMFGKGMDNRLPNQSEKRAFDEKIKTFSAITVAATEWVRPDEAECVSADGPGIPAARYRDLVAKYPKADLIVSLVGPPCLTNEDLARLPEKYPSTFAVLLGIPTGFGLSRLFAQRVLVELVVSARGVGGLGNPAPSSATEPDDFARFYQIITADNISALPGAGL